VDEAAGRSTRCSFAPAHAPELERHDGQSWHLHFHAAGNSLPEGWAAGCATGLAVVLGGELYDRLGVCTAPRCDRVYVDTSRKRHPPVLLHLVPEPGQDRGLPRAHALTPIGCTLGGSGFTAGSSACIGSTAMFERFTGQSRRAVVLAQEEAASLDHNYIGTEHLLLGLLHEGEGAAARALASADIALAPAGERSR